MTIAIEIGRCIRYLHEECTEGPLVHGNLQPCNIFLSRDLKPMISSIKYTRQLQREKSESSHERTPKSFKTRDHGGTEDDEVAEEHQHMTPKLDVYSFGVLLLRLFCRGFQDERELLQWARPLLARHAFHELLDGRLEGCDTYELYRVMLTAAACISLPPLGRPTITQVVSMLESRNSSILTPSPSSSCQSPAKV
ncbi:probable receptor-like serine/threonine-protein kinase At5g57670 isoform X2 [Amborella trichopoda]|uniref:probable receptor-like serine/threonine-protein kinase At5g57670 isoform X2 n=1 Tax=Amborella trichopoda TaxID=13333 RepID=UPI0009BCAFC4|nr:probable receptor-like serine/threonine-protein kinase At5g57670 isoform X2 [Amborella trichopoda]|eukprot:XP_020521262.1 probable receptor-like serine/threonine-protein kinase At5g57670 isoform X2 [Amborella trichopoda]